MILIDDGFRGSAFFHRLHGNGCAVLVASTYKYHISFLRTLVTYINVCEKVDARKVAYMVKHVGIWLGCCYEISAELIHDGGKYNDSIFTSPAKTPPVPLAHQW